MAGITPIFANSPQAKGRVERPFGVLQDRLVAELGLRGIRDPQTANSFLHDVFIDDYNRRFAVNSEIAQPAWRKPSTDLDLETVLSFRYQATVANDNAVRLEGMIIDIPPGPGGRGYAKAKVQLRQLLDGSWRVYHQGRLIAQTQPTPLTQPIRASKRRKNPHRAAANQHLVYRASAIKKGDTFPWQLRGQIDFAKTPFPKRRGWGVMDWPPPRPGVMVLPGISCAYLSGRDNHRRLPWQGSRRRNATSTPAALAELL